MCRLDNHDQLDSGKEFEYWSDKERLISYGFIFSVSLSRLTHGERRGGTNVLRCKQRVSVGKKFSGRQLLRIAKGTCKTG